ncbi:MAG: hypothetical protein LKK12_01595 [Bacteroidales bacterium]|jgi:hypothetical protein|nr:hypothetical protein [Bacteroidales bacterium]MCI2133056.1 hypothetical protein [Bacteroidales bacterium]
MGKKVDYDKMALENFRLAMNATMEMKSYSEKLSEDGINETSFFCIAVRVYTEKDQDLIKATLQMMALSLADSEKFGGDIEKAENHIIERGQYFTQLIEDILNNPYQFDPNPLYCALYRYPLSDVRYSPVGPSDPEAFKECVQKMFVKMMQDKIVCN